MITRHSGAEVEALAALAAAVRYTNIDDAPEDYRDELIADTDGRLSCSEVMRELTGRGREWDSYNGTGRLVWHPVDGVVAMLDGRLDVLSVYPRRRLGRIVCVNTSTTTMTARGVVDTAFRAAVKIKEDMS